MSKFGVIFDRACSRHGEDVILERLKAAKPTTAKQLAAIPDDRWLAQATKCIFQSGFNWKVIEAKWAGFEEAFEGFDLGRWILSTDDDIVALASDTRIVRNGQKIKTVPENARFIGEIAKEHGSFGNWVAAQPSTHRNEMLASMHKRGSRLGAMTGQYFLRFMNVDCYILSRDVTAALIHSGVVDKQPTSAKAMVNVQHAFNEWMEETGYGLSQLSRALAMSIDG